MISWEKVIGCFKESSHRIINTVDLSQEYWNQKSLYKGMTADDETVLYLVHSSVMPFVTFKNNVAVIVLEDKGQVYEEHILGLTGNTLFVNEPQDVSKGIIALDAEFQIQFKIGYIMQKLLEVVSRDGGIQRIIEMISEFFQEPIALLDTTFRFIARSETYKPLSGKSRFSDDVHYGIGYNRTMLEYFRSRGLLEKMMHTMTSFRFKVQDEENAYYMPVIVNKIKVAYLIIYSNKQETNLEEYYLEYLPLFSKMISIELAKRNFYLFNKGTYFNYIFNSILSGEMTDVEDIRMRLQIHGYELREYMYLIEIDSKADRGKEIEKNRVAESIRRTFRNGFYVFIDGRIFFLISRFKGEIPNMNEIDTWRMSLKSQNLIGAMTGPFKDFSEIHKHMKEVGMVLEAILQNQDAENMYTFDEYQTKGMISYLKKEEYDLFLYRPVLELIQYDDSHGTELVATLKEYLKHPKDIAAICDMLCIHKNTLYKRLDKIDMIMQCDYRNGYEIMKIELTLELLKK